jgi:hypothetical protein
MNVRPNFKLLFSDIKLDEMKRSIFFICRKVESPPVQLLHIECVDKLLGAALLHPAVPGGLPGLPALLRPRPAARGRDGDLQHRQHQLRDEHKHTQGQQCTKLTKETLPGYKIHFSWMNNYVWILNGSKHEIFGYSVFYAIQACMGRWLSN